jgi:hypothetical protein
MRLAFMVLCAAAALTITGPSRAQDNTAPVAEQVAPTAETTAPTDQAAPPAESAPTAPAETQTPVAPVVTLPEGINAPPAGKGQIVFFRPAGQPGFLLTFTVRENEAAVGRLQSARYFVHVAEPGIHEYEAGNNDTMRMEIEDGETYFVVQSVQMGIVAGRAVLAPSNQAAFVQARPRMRVATED